MSLIVSANRNAEAVTLSDVKDDRHTARSAMRGLIIAASNLHSSSSADLTSRAEKVAAVAATHAASVDSHSRFPSEAIGAARAEKLLGVAVPPELGGEGASVSDVVDICYMLGRSCASTAMVYAMHQTNVACLVRHGQGSAWHQRLLRRLCGEQILLASSTTEGRSGGDVRSQFGADRVARLAHCAGTAGDSHLLRRSGRWHPHHRAPLA